MKETIGHYKIIAELGRGGMGVVYKAHEQSLNRYVAIKALGSHLGEDPSYVERFVREAQSAASLNHPNIVQIYAINEEDGQHYFVMEYVEGTSVLRMVRERGKLDALRAARIVLQTSSGLQAAHDKGIIHRDIKPANLMVNERGLVKIADFGLALALGGTSRLTATGMFMGTPGYLSPEQCLDEEIDHRTDIYSLGVSYFEMLTGKVPFTADSPLALLRQIIEVEPPDVRDINADVDDESREILMRMMAKDRDQRYQDCNAVMEDVQAYVESRGGVGAAAGTSPGNLVFPASQPERYRSEAKTLDQSPTMPVPSGEAEAPAAPPPPPIGGAPTGAPVGADQSEPEAIVDQAPPTRSNRLPLLIGLVVVVFCLGIAGATAVAWKMGWIDKAGELVRGTKDGVDITADASAVEAPESIDSGVSGAAGGVLTPEMVVEVPDQEGETQGEPRDGSSGSGAEVEDAPGEPSARPKQHVTAQTGREARSGSDDSGEPPEARSQPSVARDSKPMKRDAQDTAPIEIRQPEGIVVVARGEQLLAGAAEAFIESALQRRGKTVIDEQRIPALADLLQFEGDGTSQLLSSLDGYAHYLVVVRAEYLGERPLKFMGRYEKAFQSRLRVVGYDIQAGTAVGPGINEKIEYTHLNVERKVDSFLRRRMGRMVDALP